MQVVMLYSQFFNSCGTDRHVGGVETYLWNLAKLVAERGDEPVLIQMGTPAFAKQVETMRVIGVPPSRHRLRSNIRRDLYEYALSCIDTTKDVIIFGADSLSVRTDYPRALSIQHGVSWDLPGRFLRGSWLGRIPVAPDQMCKKYMSSRALSNFSNCANRVCVDYNFLNWYRTQVVDAPCGKIWVIPNFVDVPPGYQPNMKRHQVKPVKILFARRFVEYRGLRLMIDAAKRLLDMFEQVEFCFAGEGPDGDLIRAAFAEEARVSIRKYFPEESLRVHEAFHIAVVPSLGSEGTSLSLAEAMASGCAVVATDVGGMTNMVIDGYNGRLIRPYIDNLMDALTELIADCDLRLRLATQSAETASHAFSLQRWKSRWSTVLDEVQKG